MTIATEKRPVILAVWLVIAGIAGLAAAFELTVEDFHVLENPGEAASCDFSPFVQCTANLESWQGSAFGFPNPIIGLVCWTAPVVVGMAVLAGARFAKWFWALYTLGHTFAFGFVCWLIYQSFFSLYTLCPWCALTWVVTIPSFFAVLLHSVRIGAIPLGSRMRRTANSLMAWVPLLAIVCYAVIAVMAEVQLGAMSWILDQIF